MPREALYSWLLPYYYSVRVDDAWQTLPAPDRWRLLADRVTVNDAHRATDLRVIQSYGREPEALETLEQLWRSGQPRIRLVAS